MHIDGCPCCIEDKEIAVLLSQPLRRISADQISAYASSVFLTVGSVEDFRYFLPRILEIVMTDAAWWPDPEVVGRSLVNAAWLRWDDSERQAIAAVLDAQFDLVAHRGEGREVDSWLCALARSGLNLTPYLRRLSENPPCALSFYEWNAGKVSTGGLTSGFWDDVPEEAARVIAWFGSPPAWETVFNAYGVDLSIEPK